MAVESAGMVKPSHPELDRLQLAELLDFRPDLGIIRLHEQRVVILSAAAMGLLRKELIDTFGSDVARRLMLRFGYADGYHDAVNLRDRSAVDRPARRPSARARSCTRSRASCASEIDPARRDDDGRFDAEFAWHDSYEAEQHVHHYGRADDPVCWSLVGYASGYASACLGQEVYFREAACLGQGAKRCTVIGRDAAAWGDDLRDAAGRLSGRRSDGGDRSAADGRASPARRSWPSASACWNGASGS